MFFDVTSIQVSSVQSSAYQGYTVRITAFVLIIVLKKMLLHCKVSYPLWRNFNPNNNFSFIQDSAPSHRTKIIQNFLLEELKSRFVANTEWPPSSPDFGLLDYYFRNEVKEKVYSCHDAKHFDDERVQRVQRQDFLCVRPMCYKCWTTSQNMKTVFTTFKSSCNKWRKTDEDRVWLNFVLLLLKFMRKGEFSTEM